MLRNNNLNKIKTIACVLCLLVVGYSCNDLVDEAPISEIGPEIFFNNNDDLEAGVIAIYDGMQGTYRDKTFYWGEFRSDNHAPVTSGQATATNLEVVNNDVTQGNPAVKWDRLYRMIDRANQVILNAPNIPNYNANFLAEALALRAKAYFDAVRVWGAVPLFIEPVKILSDAYKPVTDGATIMNQVVIPDMVRAQELMTSLASDFRFSRSSIYCLQAEVYMWLRDYPKAKVAMDALISLGQHSLVTTPEAWDDMFYNTPLGTLSDARGKQQFGSELILSIRYDLNEEPSSGGTWNNRSGIGSLFYAGLPSYALSPEIENKWRAKFPVDSLEWVTKYPGKTPPLTRTFIVDDGLGGLVEEVRPVYGDFRYYYSRQGRVNSFSSYEIGAALTAKWQQTNISTSVDDTDIALYRYADMILLLAEAENQLGSTISDANTTRALQLVNQIRTARKLPTVTTAEFGATKEARLDFILDERQFELFGEGKRWWDLLRNNKALEILNPILEARSGGVPLTQDRLVWPIHVDHLIDNTLLEQNLGYRN